MQASLEPVVEHPVGRSASEAPEVGEHSHAPGLDLGGLGVLVAVDHVAIGALIKQSVRRRLHPGRHECRQIQPGVAVEHQLVVDDLVGRLSRQPVRCKPVARNVVELPALGEVGTDAEELGIRILTRVFAVQWHIAAPGIGLSCVRMVCSLRGAAT
jgi:hypothetical protein